MEYTGYGQERLKDIVEKEAAGEEKPAAAKEDEEAKEQRQEPAPVKEQPQDDDKWYDTVTQIKLVCKGKRLQAFRVTGNLNDSNTKMTMANIIPHIEMKVKVIYSFKSVIYRGDGEIISYSKALDSSPRMFTSLKEIQADIEECEQNWFDLDNEEVWSKAYLPTTGTTKIRGNYEGKVVFKHVQIKLVASNEPLMGCGPLPSWLNDKRYIYAIDKFDDNLCVWQCPAIYMRKNIQWGTEFVTRTTLKLVREYYGNKNLKKKGHEAHKTC